MILLWRMELCQQNDFENWKLRQTQHSTSTAKCTLRVVCLLFTYGTSSMVLQVITINIDIIELLHTTLFTNCLLFYTGVILIKRAGDGARNIKGCWDSIHVIEVQEKSTGRSAHYKLTSTVMLWLQTSRPGSGTMNLGGSLTRQVSNYFNYASIICSLTLLLMLIDGTGWNSCRTIFSHCQYGKVSGGYGEQNSPHVERDLLWKDQRYRQWSEIHSTTS